VTEVLSAVRAHLRAHFAALGIEAEPVSASVTFLGLQPIEVMRFGPDEDGVFQYVSLGCSRHPMTVAADLVGGPRAEVMLALRGATPTGLARSVAVLAAAPAVEGLVLEPDALVDLGQALWGVGGAPFTAVLLGRSDVADLQWGAESLYEPVAFLTATPITATEAAWVRLKGAAALREAWRADGVDVLDPGRRASSPT
jgi:hypothetical protein